jgi:NADH-quinone oxidoreductase subunit L
MPTSALTIDWGIQLDQLSMLMTLVVTGVGALIHVFSIGYMRADPGYARYFAYLNLFVAFMLVLVLGSSYPVLFVGWEGVGLCSYLLIGFWFNERANVQAGTKAFVVNRIGDFGFLVAMFLMWSTVQRLDFVGAHAALAPMAGTGVVLAIALFLFLGLCGKECAVAVVHVAPGRDGRPDARVGPHPRGDDGHAGVYLVARASPIFAGAPSASLLVTLVGAVTAVFAATIALRQWDIKKVLAYSTVSQAGIHVHRGRKWRVHRRHLPPGDARVLQGAPVPWRGLGDSCASRGVSPLSSSRGRARPAQHGWAVALHARDGNHHGAGHAGHRRCATAGRLLLEG